ncbi:TlpA family protein disulfide reductase [bacterium LRH843]|nr:TlpA family protein disulfide reductase [bacterium LRH843]
MKRVTTGIVVIAAVFIIIAVFFFQDRQEVGNRPGMIAEDFSLPMHEQESSNLHDYFGDVIILNMWASWCEPCKKEMPDLMKLQADYNEKGLTILTVNMQTFERTLKDAPEFIKEMNITLPVFFDEAGVVADRYQIIGMPITYIIGRDGTIEMQIPGEVNYEKLETIIKPLL